MNTLTERNSLIALAVTFVLVILAVIRVGSDEPPPQQSSVTDQIAQAETEAKIELNQSPVQSEGEQTELVAQGDTPPAFTLPSTNGESISLSDYQGQPLVIEFIATWCPHCQAMAPRFDEVMGKYPDVGYLVVGAADEKESTVIKWHDDFLGHPMRGDLAFDPNLSVARQYGIEGYPLTVFINSEGQVSDSFSGEMDEKLLENKVKALESE